MKSNLSLVIFSPEEENVRSHKGGDQLVRTLPHAQKEQCPHD